MRRYLLEKGANVYNKGNTAATINYRERIKSEILLQEDYQRIIEPNIDPKKGTTSKRVA